ncbi:hypothetical protein PG994_012151 [Apiospora phragmitis]|uniref:gamma-glutamylcyclotransferase n=1 Tax=Apiospora phragmitis TaxID=2905665 RepID=A0ABR1TX41_9PEZI
MDCKSAGAQQACQAVRCIQDLRSLSTGNDASPLYPPISSIPRTSPERLAQASPDHGDNDPSSPKNARTYLYLAYGSNLSAETFLGVRGIRPLSKVNVSAPAFDLTINLPGIPYREPCFANIAPRKHLPDPLKPPQRPPQFPPPPAQPSSNGNDVEKAGGLLFPSLPPRAPTWSKGLIGVVYEVTPEDYATIIRTEGGGAGYLDVQTPVVALPAPITVPEKPPIPELPRPFLAHTLYQPRLPDAPPDNDDDDDDDERKQNDEPDKPKKKWWYKFVAPVRRPEPDYAQASARYLKLITDGAAEHALPDDYQAYLHRLQAYTITRRRQEIGKWLFSLLWLPLFYAAMTFSKMASDKNGNFPRWLAVAMAVLLNLMWMSYDAVFVKWFGDGERTMEEEDDDDDDERVATRNRKSRWLQMELGTLNEKNRLTSDW